MAREPSRAGSRAKVEPSRASFTSSWNGRAEPSRARSGTEPHRAEPSRARLGSFPALRATSFCVGIVHLSILGILELVADECVSSFSDLKELVIFSLYANLPPYSCIQ